MAKSESPSRGTVRSEPTTDDMERWFLRSLAHQIGLIAAESRQNTGYLMLCLNDLRHWRAGEPEGEDPRSAFGRAYENVAHLSRRLDTLTADLEEAYEALAEPREDHGTESSVARS